ncbi:MAG: alpha/beta fold hydrolase [Pelovirga sp.]
MSWLDRETERARSEGVEHPENYPYLLQPHHPNGHGVVLIHGFGASPRELYPLGKTLQEHDFTVAGVRLPGHGTSPQDLKSRHATEWIDAACAGYQALSEHALRVSVGGLSTGALIALSLAARQPVEKLLLLAPFMRLRHRLAPLAGVLSPLFSYQNRIIAEHERDFYYPQRPLRGIAQINKLLRQMPRILPDISVPTLVLTSTGDATIAPGSAMQLYRQLGSPDKQIHCYGDEVPHVLTSPDNPHRDDVLARCIAFFSQDRDV